METRVYFNAKPVKKRIEKYASEEDKSRSDWPRFDWYEFYTDQGLDHEPDLVYCNLKHLSDSLSRLAKGLKAVRISLHDVLHLTQNKHIKQGEGKFGNQGTKFEISYRPKDVEVSSDEFYGETRITEISIWVTGTNLKSIFDCYRQIREGKLPTGNWKGEAISPIKTEE